MGMWQLRSIVAKAQQMRSRLSWRDEAKTWSLRGYTWHERGLRVRLLGEVPDEVMSACGSERSCCASELR